MYACAVYFYYIIGILLFLLITVHTNDFSNFNYWNTLSCFQMTNGSVCSLQIRGTYGDINAATLYDVIHDPVYRPTWDPNILEGKEICRIDSCNDIGYYASMYLIVAIKGLTIRVGLCISLYCSDSFSSGVIAWILFVYKYKLI